MTKVRLFLALPLFVVLAAGCGLKNPNAPAKVSGTITYKGEPLKGGTVMFHHKESGALSVPIGKDGTYSATDVAAGDMVVTVETESINPNKKKQKYGGGGGMQEYKPPGAPADAGKPPDPSLYVKIPEKYSKKEKSGLTVTLTPGKQTKDFDLTD